MAQVPIYQICKSFRDDPLTAIHKRRVLHVGVLSAGADISVTSAEMKSLIAMLKGEPLQFDELTVPKPVREFPGSIFFAADFRSQVESIAGVNLSADDEWDDIYFKLMVEKIEPAIGRVRPMVLRDFPASLASLSKVEGVPPVAKRFEIYWQGWSFVTVLTKLTDLSALEETCFGGTKNSPPPKIKLPIPFRIASTGDERDYLRLREWRLASIAFLIVCTKDPWRSSANPSS